MQHTRRMAIRLAALLAQLVATSCVDESTATHLDPVDCGSLDLVACAKASGCEIGAGNLVDEAQQCIGQSAPVGCMTSVDRQGGCDDALGYVRDRQGRIWRFGNLCLPEGLEQVDQQRAWSSWESCDVPVATPDVPCASLSVGSCARAPHCGVVEARWVVQHRGCIEDELVQLACADRAESCQPGPGYGRDSQERVWQFSNLCVPARFQSVTPTPAQPWSSWGSCKPLPSPPITPCSDLSIGQCEREGSCQLLRGLQYDAARTCRSALLTEVGCAPSTQSCRPQTVHARSAQGATFEITGGCAPVGFQQVDAPTVNIASWPICQ